MPRYTVAHAYTANHNGRQFGPWAKGEEIELDERDAEWVQRDSPGALAPADDKATKPPAKRGGRGRST